MLENYREGNGKVGALPKSTPSTQPQWVLHLSPPSQGNLGRVGSRRSELQGIATLGKDGLWPVFSDHILTAH